MVRRIVDSLIGAVVGLIVGPPVGVITGSVGMAIFHIILKLTVEDPTPGDSLDIGFAVVAGAMTGLFTIPVGLIVGAVVGAVAGVRSHDGVIAVVCGCGIGAGAGLLAGVGVVFADLLVSGHRITLFHYLAYSDLFMGVSFIVAAGVVIGICAGVVIGRILKRQRTVI